MVSSVSLFGDLTLWARDVISGAIADPLSNRQQQSGDPGSNARFVMTSWPSRPSVYPFITVSHITTNDTNLGMQTEDSISKNVLQVDVWTKQVSQRDGFAGSVAWAIRNTQLGSNGGLASGLYDIRLISARNLDEPGKGGLHRKSLDFEISFINTT